MTGGHFISHLYLLAFPPLFPVLRGEFGLSNTQLGLLISVISIAMLLQAPIGILVDRFGAKWIFVSGVIVTSGSIALAAFSNSYFLLVTAAVLSGVGQSTFHPANYSLLDSISTTENKGRIFGIHTFGGYAGFAVAPILIGTIATLYDWRIALGAVGTVGLFFGVLAAGVLKRVSTEHNDGSSYGGVSAIKFVFQREILVISLFFVLFTMAGKGLQTFTPLLAVDGYFLTDEVGNAALSVFFVTTAICVLVGGVVADRFDARIVILGASFFVAVMLIVVTSEIIPVDARVLIVVFALAGAGYGLIFASRDKLVSLYTSDGTMGFNFGFVFTVSSMGSLVSPVLLGAVIDLTTVVFAFLIVGGLFLFAGVVMVLLKEG